ncbi:MAG: hypothetical protein VW840_07975, partial [Gammaproteobacteria bacterium]
SPGGGRSIAGIVLAMALGWTLSGCTTSVVVEGSVPTPLVAKIPARVGVYYSDEFRNYRYQEVIRDSGTWNIDLGSQNLSFFDNLLETLFESVAEIPEPPLTREEMASLDGVFIPRIEKYGFLTPGISGLKFYSASIEYRIALYNKAGQKVGDWNIIGYGKSEGGMFTADEAINEATVLAIRDGGARIAIELIDQPSVRAWIDTLAPLQPEPTANQAETAPAGASEAVPEA